MTQDWRGLSQRLGLGLFAFSALLFAPPLEDAFVLPQRLALSLALLLLALAAPPRLPWGRLGWLLLGFFAWRFCSRGLADPPGSTGAWLAEQSVYWGLLVLGSAALAQAALLAYSAVALLSVGVGVCGVALLPRLGLGAISAGSVDLGFARRAYGSLGNPDFLGGYLALLLPLAAALAWTQRERARALALGAGALFLLTLGLTQARASWLAAACGLAVTFAVLRPASFSRRRIVSAALALTLLLGLGFAQRRSLPPRLAEAFNLRSDAWQARAFMAGTALDIAVAHPWIGVGAGGFTDAYLQRQGERLSAGEDQPYRLTYAAHNDWMQLAAESGWLALLLWVWAFAWALRVACKRGGPDGATVAGTLTAFAVQASFHFPWAIWPSAGLLMLALAWAVAQQAEGNLAFPAWGRYSAALALVFAVALGLRQSASSALLNSAQSALLRPAMQAYVEPFFAKAGALRRDDGRAWLGLGDRQLHLGELDAAIDSFQQAIQVRPSQPENWVNLGLALGQQGSLEPAERVCAQGVALNPRSSEAWGNWAKVAWMQGRTATAEARMRQGLKEAGPSAQASFNLGAILYNERRFKEAAQAFAAVLALQPDHAQAKRLLQESLHAH